MWQIHDKRSDFNRDERERLISVCLGLSIGAANVVGPLCCHQMIPSGHDQTLLVVTPGVLIYMSHVVFLFVLTNRYI